MLNSREKDRDDTKDEIKRLKGVFLSDAVINIVSRFFSGNGPYPPETAEYKALTGSVIKAERLLKIFGFDINKLIPGEETVLETLKHFLYNDRTGDDERITFMME